MCLVMHIATTDMPEQKPMNTHAHTHYTCTWKIHTHMLKTQQTE